MRDFAPAQRVMVNTTDQANSWHHNWQLGGDTSAYVGWADASGNVAVGPEGSVPLNQHATLFGPFHYIIPSTQRRDVHSTLGVDDVLTQETWNISLGITFYRGPEAAARDVSGVFELHLLSVADNGTFSYQASNL